MEETKKILALTPLIFFSLLWTVSAAETHSWKKMNEGLFLGGFDPRIKSKICNRKIIILKIDPKFFSFKLLSASEHGRKSRTVKQWSEEFGLLAAINASMYQSRDFLKSTGYMKSYGHFNNSYMNKKFGSLMVFNPVDASLPEVQIIDRRLQKNWKSLIKKYHTIVQNYRMISDGKKRGWPQEKVLHSTAAIGMDRDNNVLFILSPSPFSTHDFIHILLSLPINIKNAMYVEGGPEATLYLKDHDRSMTFLGSCETDITKPYDAESRFKLPNIIGVVKRRKSTDQ